MLTSDGVLHPKMGLIRWDEITRLRIYRPGSVTMLGIDVANRDALRERVGSRFFRTLMRADELGHAATISIPGSTITVSVEELGSEIELRAGREYPRR